MKNSLYWCMGTNFGDELNNYIFNLVKLKTYFKGQNEAQILGIGSLLDFFLLDNKTNYIKKPIHVFSTGFGFEEDGFFHNPDIILPEQLNRKTIPYALRGKLTLKRMQKLLKSSLKNVVIGDGGLLASYLINKAKITKKYKLGIVPHAADSKNPIFEKIKNNIKNSIILDVNINPIEFLKQLAQCEMIISTAMHPLIVADSLNIPNLWVRVSDKTTSKYKFYDYYSVYNLKKEPYYLTDEIFDINLISNNYDIKKEDVEKIKKNLLKAFKKMKKDLTVKYYIDKLKTAIIRFFTIFIPIKKYRKKFRDFFLS